MLFGKKKKKTVRTAPAKSAPAKKILFTKTFVQSDSFKGYRRIRLTTYMEKGVDSTLAYFEKSGYDFTGCKIRIESVCILDQFTDGDLKVVNVYVSGKRIGCVYDSSGSYDMITDESYDQAHIRCENGDVYLFLHYPAGDPISVTIE